MSDADEHDGPDRPPDTGLDLRRARDVALKLLTRREHSRHELATKLAARGVSPEIARAVLARLVDEGLVSDQRFAESFVRARLGRGFGPRRVALELQQHEIESTIIDQALAADEADPVAQAAALIEKRLGGRAIMDRSEQARLSRYLAGRGFEYGEIRAALRRVQGQDDD